MKGNEAFEKVVSMKRIASFEKVSYEQFEKDYRELYPECPGIMIENIYNSIKLPKRATSGSAGYDFVSPIDYIIETKHGVLIPTGIRCKIDDGWVLQCYPRSSLGFKYRVQLDNTVGIIDSDYYYSDNEGHIFARITNDNYENKSLSIKAGDRFMQGVFVKYGITYEDNVKTKRNGGIGSTNKKGTKHE
jgi:dUTP pyrophosphatase